MLLATIVVSEPAQAQTIQAGERKATDTGTIGRGATPGGKVTREQVIERAEAWVRQQVPYSRNGLNSPHSWWSDEATGGHYRQDCSGFVSMAWQLESSLSTRSLPSVSTRIGTADLSPGDILNSSAHVVIFGGWNDQARGTFTYYQQSSRSRPAGKYTGNVHAAAVAGHPTASYTALRYKNITDGTIPVKRPPAPEPDRPTAAPGRGAVLSAESAFRPAPVPSAAPSRSPAQASVGSARSARTWVNASSGKCLEIRGDTTGNGDMASQWECNLSATQKWITTATDGRSTLTNANSGLCLEIRGDALHHTATANQWHCNTSATQTWRLNSAPKGGWSLVNANSGLCLEVAGGASHNGALAQQNTCNGSPAQRWL
ncbi:RICIN domain-containing protein [Streptomyces zhihengii]|uniref:RICIN domain-containing protein n=1 Tax=Streptomyces zhihengii TaxID=1818004 RepID=UPI00369F7C52